MHFQGELSARLLLGFDKEDGLIARWSYSMGNSSGFCFAHISYAHLPLNSLLFRNCSSHVCVACAKCYVWGRGETGYSYRKH